MLLKVYFVVNDPSVDLHIVNVIVNGGVTVAAFLSRFQVIIVTFPNWHKGNWRSHWWFLTLDVQILIFREIWANEWEASPIFQSFLSLLFWSICPSKVVNVTLFGRYLFICKPSCISWLVPVISSLCVWDMHIFLDVRFVKPYWLCTNLFSYGMEYKNFLTFVRNFFEFIKVKFLNFDVKSVRFIEEHLFHIHEYIDCHGWFDN